MNPSPHQFAELLSLAIRQIAREQRLRIRALQDEIGIELGYSGGDMIEYWRKGQHVPPPAKLNGLLCALRRRTKLERTWVEQIVAAAGYSEEAVLGNEWPEREPTPVASPDLPHASPTPPVPQPLTPIAATVQPTAEPKPDPGAGAPDLSWFEQRQLAREWQNRRALLQVIRKSWLEDVLAEALAGLPPLVLPLLTAPAAVTDSWDAWRPARAKTAQLLSATTLIASFCTQSQHSLLLLGEAGAGKTTLLLLLAQALVEKAEQELSQPLPVIFNLATWSAKAQPIEEWLVDELQNKYHIPKAIGHGWLVNHDLALLLDGLDEVDSRSRHACVAAINAFADEHLAPLVVCCRTTVYDALPVRLACQEAVAVQPLSPAQVNAYLTQCDPTGTLGQWLQGDEALQALSRTPLLLNLMTITYRELPLIERQRPLSLEDRRQQLLTAYVVHMSSRRADRAPFTPTQTVHWLGWLARQMNAHAMQLFMVETLQPSWLEYAWQRAAYAGWAALIGGLTYWLMIGLVFGPTHGLMAALVGAALFFVRTAAELAQIKPAAVLRWSWLAGRTGVLGGLIFGLLAGLGGALSFWLVFGLIGGQSLGLFSKLLLKTSDDRRYTANHELLIGLLGGAIVGACCGFGAGLLVGIASTTLYCTLWRAKPYPLWVSGASGLLSGVIGALLGEFSRVLSLSLHDRIAAGIGDGLVRGAVLTLGSGVGGLVGGFCAGLLLALFGGLLGGLVYRETIEIHRRPNQGIVQSGRNALKVGGGLMVTASVAFLLINELVTGMLTWWQAAVSFGLLGGLSYGGFAYLLHYGLRAILWSSGLIPWRYVAFLDYSVEQSLLYRVGSGYIFIHRLLLEHVATFSSAPPPTATKEKSWQGSTPIIVEQP